MSAYQYGIQSQMAPEWGVDTWFNLPPEQKTLKLADLKGKIVYLYNFQSWCPGCHSHGFPTLKAVLEQISDSADVAFVAIQTVFEGFASNTLASAHEVAKRHGLDIPFGHDPGPNNSGSTVMRNYRSGGTPWTVVIEQNGVVRYNDFHANADEMVQLIKTLQQEPIAIPG